MSFGPGFVIFRIPYKNWTTDFSLILRKLSERIFINQALLFTQAFTLTIIRTSIRFVDFSVKMLFRATIYFTVYVMLNTEEANGFLMHGKPNSSTGHNSEMKEIMQILQNQTTELENLKREAENDRTTIKILLNQSHEMENLKQKSENDTFQIKLLQELIQNMTANVRNDNNVTERFNSVDKHLNDLNVQFRYTNLSLLDIQTMAEEMNGTMLRMLGEINGHDRSTFKLLLNQSNELETLKRDAENDRSTIKLLLNKSNEMENLKGEMENERSTINLLLNQSNELENLKQKVEKDAVKINFLHTQNQNLIQNMTTNREMDKNITERLNDLDKHLNDLKVQVRYISLSLLDVQAMAEEINGSIIQPFEEKIGTLIESIRRTYIFETNPEIRVNLNFIITINFDIWNHLVSQDVARACTGSGFMFVHAEI